MARLNVNPTRMEMTRLKGQLKTATRGHKLLKDKLDELMKQFMEIVRENKRLREEAETALENAYKNFIIARAVLSEASLGEALMIPQQSVSVKVGKQKLFRKSPALARAGGAGRHDGIRPQKGGRR